MEQGKIIEAEVPTRFFYSSGHLAALRLRSTAAVELGRCTAWSLDVSGRTGRNSGDRYVLLTVGVLVRYRSAG